MRFNNSSGYYEKNPITISNAPVIFTLRFQIPTVAAFEPIVVMNFPAVAFIDIFVPVTGVLFMRVYNSAGVQCCNVSTQARVDNNQMHYVYFEYRPATGAVIFIMDGLNVDWLGLPTRKANVATLTAAANCLIKVGYNNFAAAYWPANLGCFGFHQVSGPVWTDFMYANGLPKKLNISTWAEWTSQPRIWHESGKLDENRGTLGALTKNGTIVLDLPENWS
jgi:hypothetical protein